ncbi:MAG TPA: histidine phosphatase family protein [Flavobacterium sp.]|uniref:SixA phosphatase family protein n=1 Tax=unclassified Flavobacterium TaxID=196869 RepID=UPI0025B9C35D|nr:MULTISPECIES: histidine phosphatase family protein [unclassified Flavobacterium]HRE77368.1 histidine phosphatase family protein [Flavobacterium sp.]
MKNLILIRHAKSSWDAPVHDKERVLAQRGVRDAHLMAQNISEFIPKLNLIWSSTAKRASETAIIFAQNQMWPLESIIFKDELYTFDASKLEKVIKSCDDSYENVILFGHNEAITDFVNKFGDIFIDNVPTAGFVSLSFTSDSWANISNGKTKKILFPRDLKDD